MKMRPVSKKVKLAVGIVLVAAYVAGLVAMFMVSMNMGMLLWIISTVGGAGFLYYNKKCEEANADGEQPEDKAE
ncbi:MAG: hypothetical protein RR452_01770 [Clostridia bacterium]